MQEQLHRKYGDIVRIAPNELSFSSVKSYKGIYGRPSEEKLLFTKAPVYDGLFSPPGLVNIRDPAIHRRQKQDLGPAFSAASLRKQEGIIHQYVDMFLQLIGKIGGPDTEGANLAEGFNWLTFDIVGDLAFGESFDAVASGKTSHWESISHNRHYWASLQGFCKQFPLLYLVIPFIASRKILEDYRTYQRMAAEKTKRRVERQHDGASRADFFDHVLRKGDYPLATMESQASTLIGAGSETITAALWVSSFFLLQHPQCLRKLQQEVRGAFASLEEITGDSAARLPYLRGVIDEGMRLCPPASMGGTRVSPGAMVDGHYIPAGTYVSTNPWVTQRDPRYWRDPESFRPERWIGNGFGDTKEAFQPFSLGPRVCIGMNMAYLELRIILAKMVWQYDWELATPGIDLYRDSKLYVLWNHPEMRVRFHSRMDI